METHVTVVQWWCGAVILREIGGGRVLWSVVRPGWGETTHPTLGDARRAARGVR